MLTVATFNAHVGLGLISGGLKWLLRRHPWVAIVLVQEGRHFAALKHNLGRRYRTYPRTEQPGVPVKTQAMTYVAFLRVRFKFIKGWNHDIQQGGHYPRRCTAVLLYDRLLRRKVLAVSMHPDPLGAGLDRGAPTAVRIHQLQMNEYLRLIAMVQDDHPGVLVVAGGDVNEDLGLPVPPRFLEMSALGGLDGRGLVAAHKATAQTAKLDDIWLTRKGTEILSRESVTVPTHGMDHPATVVRARAGKP